MTRRLTTLLTVTAALVIPLLTPTASHGEEGGAAKLTRQESEFFEKRVRPLFIKHCYKCHSSKTKQKGGLELDSAEGWMNGGDSGPAIVPGDIRKSLLLKAVSHTDPDLEMPPKKRLSEEELRVLTRWVKIGAPDPRQSTGRTKATASEQGADNGSIDVEKGREFWSFRPPAAHPVPQVKNGTWAIDDIDRFVLARLESKSLAPVGDASRETYIRRVTFDLTGLPPSPDELESFVNSKSPRAHRELVDRLLASPRFGERWGRHWLDVARYAESTGKTRNYPYSHAWRYRDWVIAAFNSDKPFDRFITEQVAGDLLPAKDAKSRDSLRAATAFLALGPKDLNERDQKQFAMDNVDEQIDVTTRSVLGLTVSCARCHDHKFDPIPTRDYYALAGIFRSTEQLVGLSSKRGGGNRYQTNQLYPVTALAQKNAKSAPPPPPPKPSGLSNKEVKKIQQEIATLRKEMRQIQKTKKSRANQKKQRTRKKPGVAANTTSDAAQDAREREIRQKIRKLNQKIAGNKNAKKNRKGGKRPEGPAVMGVRELATPVDCRVCIRGDTSNLGASVPRGFLQVLSGSNAPNIPKSGSGRLELARWLTDGKNPLTARVFVNRAWHHIFGRGLVRTVDNFGKMGERPSHPQLLDHLARRFVEKRWSMKKLIRDIVLSRTYRLSSRVNEKAVAVDPGNTLLWRMSPRRFDVEAFRDAMLATSGQLNVTPPTGSPVEKLPIGEIGRNANAVSTATRGSTNRSVYLPIVRSFLPKMFQTFDFADPSMVKGRRDVTTVATQALFLLNSAFVAEQSRLTARRVLQTKSTDDAGKVQFAYRLVLSRTPSDEETARALEYIGSTARSDKDRLDAWSGFCQALFACAEFRYLN